MDNPAQAVWVTLLRREGWLLVDVDERKVGMIIAVTEGGLLYLTIEGYHAGDSRFIGEKDNVLSAEVEPILKVMQSAFLMRV